MQTFKGLTGNSVILLAPGADVYSYFSQPASLRLFIVNTSHILRPSEAASSQHISALQFRLHMLPPSSGFKLTSLSYS
jgi:hypothetical protein